MYGIDISSYQNKIDLSKGNYDFAIVKATEGVGFKDKCFDEFVVQLTKLNKLIGCYHYARPDLNKGIDGMVREATWFVTVVEKSGLLGRAILVLDWEVEPFDRDDYISEWVATVEKLTGITPFIYGSKSKLMKWKDFWSYNHCPIWVAAWPTIEPQNAGGPWTGKMASKDVINWTIWQYSAKGKYPGFAGDVDLDYTDITMDKWRDFCTSNLKEDLSEDMIWAIDNGLFIGYGNGMYGPKNNLTREQLATVLHRYNERFGKI